MDKSPPAATLCDGNLKATIWQNEGDRGMYYSTTFSRSYKDDEGKYRDTQSFSPSDLLRVSELARQAHNQTNQLRQRDYDDSRDIDGDRAAQLKQRLQNSRGSRDQSRNRQRDR